MPTLADLDAAERRLAGDGVGGLFAEAAKHGAGAKTEDLSVSGATRADREKLLAGLRAAPARERRWAAAREKEKGNELFKAREYRSAIEAYDVSIALDATTPAPFANRAAAYMKLRRWSDAVSDCDAALALDPENFKALLRRGACVLEANEEDAAERALEDFELCVTIEAKKKKESEPSDAELVRLTEKARKMLSDAKTKAARAAMRRVAIEEDDEKMATETSSSSSDDKEATEKRSTKDAVRPEVSSARMGPMVIEEIVEDPAPAPAPPRKKIVIEEASDSDDDDASASSPDLAARVAALKDEGNACFARGAYDEAIERYDEAIRAFADSDGADETAARVDKRSRAVLYANRAASLLKRGDFARAEEDANDAVSCDASYIKGFHRRAAARTGLHKFEGALEDYEKVVRAAPESAALQREVNACMEKAAEAMLGGFAGDTPRAGTSRRRFPAARRRWPSSRTATTTATRMRRETRRPRRRWRRRLPQKKRRRHRRSRARRLRRILRARVRLPSSRRTHRTTRKSRHATRRHRPLWPCRWTKQNRNRLRRLWRKSTRVLR
jgi:tetratricopeptide (TPR) repeat protein